MSGMLDSRADGSPILKDELRTSTQRASGVDKMICMIIHKRRSTVNTIGKNNENATI